LINDEVEAVKQANRDKEQEAEKKARELRARQREIEALKRLAIERQTQNELFAIRALEIQHLKATGATALEVLDAQYQLELDKAGENANLKLMADMKYEIGKTQLIKREEESVQLKRQKHRLNVKLRMRSDIRVHVSNERTE